MSDEFDSVNFTSVIIALNRCWQEMHTNRGQHMRFAGQFFHVPDDFLISNGQDIAELRTREGYESSYVGQYPVEFSLVRGTPAQHKVEHASENSTTSHCPAKWAAGR